MNGGPAEAEDARRRNAARLTLGNRAGPLPNFDFMNGLHERPSFRFILRNMEPRVVTIRRGVIFGVMNKPGAGQRS
jgi:hypothetical protein